MFKFFKIKFYCYYLIDVKYRNVSEKILLIFLYERFIESLVFCKNIIIFR